MINKIYTPLIRFSTLLLFIAITAKSYSDPPPPPGNPGSGGGGGGPVGAPIDEIGRASCRERVSSPV